jgi:hypothetical protein
MMHLKNSNKLGQKFKKMMALASLGELLSSFFYVTKKVYEQGSTRAETHPQPICLGGLGDG